MSFVAPIWLVVAGLAAAGVVIAHLITRSQPRRDVLPTVRFIPQTAPLTVTRTRQPTDVLLLLLRLLAVALLGFALAGAHVTRRAPHRVVIVDRSLVASDNGQLRRTSTTASDGGHQRRTSTTTGDGGQQRRTSTTAGDGGQQPRTSTTTGGGVVIVFGDSSGPQTLSGALVAAHRAIAGRDYRERTELVIASPIAREQVDSATAPLLALWPGTVRVERTPLATPRSATGLHVIASGDDPILAASASLAGGLARVFRSTAPTAADSAWARDSAGALVVWPADLTGLARRQPADAQQGIAAGRHVVVGSFARTHVPRDGRAVVRWLDGAPAVTEVELGVGCVREVAIPVDIAGDLALRESFRGIVETLTSPCGGARDLAPADVASLLPRDDRPRTAGVAGDDTGRLALWLALAALAALVAEQLLRRRTP